MSTGLLAGDSACIRNWQTLKSFSATGRSVDERVANARPIGLSFSTSHWTQEAAVTQSDPRTVAANKLIEVYSEYLENATADDPAAASTSRALANALRFITSLSKAFPAPDISIDSSGDFWFEWYVRRFRTLAIAVGDGSYLHYSALIGESTIHGTERLSSSFAPAFVTVLRRIYQSNA